MKTPSQSLFLLALTAAAYPLAAQTPAAKPATSGTATAVHHTTPATAAGGCVKTFELSSKIPAVPATATCPKAMLTINFHQPNVDLVYMSPLIDKETRESLALEPKIVSLNYQDLKVGTGELAQPGKFYTIQYTGWLTDGTQFDTSVGKPDPFTFGVGKHQVIAGWDLGFAGMRVGGKRRLYIPYELGYGERGKAAPPPMTSSPPKAALVFDVELVSQSDKGPEPKAPPTPPAGAFKPGAPGAPATPGSPARPAAPATPSTPGVPASPASPADPTPATPKQ